MLGLFLTNRKGAVAYLVPDGQTRIASMRYFFDQRLVSLVTVDGDDILLAVEIAPKIDAVLRRIQSVLVVENDADGQQTGEYIVPIISC